MKYKNSVGGYIISIKKEEKMINKTESGLYIETKFNAESHIRQYATVVATIENDEVKIGDTLVFHYNVTAYHYKNKIKRPSQYILDETDTEEYYFVPYSLAHAYVSKKSGKVNFLNGNCFIYPRKQEEKKTTSGIVLELEKELDNTKNHIGKIAMINEDNDYQLKQDDEVFMPTYGNYEITMPDNKKYWCVEWKLFLAKKL